MKKASELRQVSAQNVEKSFNARQFNKAMDFVNDKLQQAAEQGELECTITIYSNQPLWSSNKSLVQSVVKKLKELEYSAVITSTEGDGPHPDLDHLNIKW